MALGVYCECGQCVPVAAKDSGYSVSCSCGRRVIVPLQEEFRENPLLLSAASLERRVQRLVAGGMLPRTDACLRCGDPEAHVVNIELQCERYTARTSGGQRFLILPFLGGVLWASWREAERVEIHGRDTDLPAPVALCMACHQQLGAPTRSSYLVRLALLLVGSVVMGYFHVLAGIGIAAVGLVLLAAFRHLAISRWQWVLKSVLKKVPVYYQVLVTYPDAVVLIPGNGLDRQERAGRQT